ncbi:MAG: rhodanese-like domain-containing protein [Gemmatimonadaceae bacterium]
MRPLIAAFFALASAGAQAPGNSMLVSTDWLARHLGDSNVVVLHVGHDQGDFRRGHIPGARQILYADVTIEHNGIGTELPPVAQLQTTFEKLGISDDSYVIIYAHADGMAPMASRVFLTLDHFGHPRIALLNGGIARWRAEGRPISTDEPPIRTGRLTPKPRTVTVDAEWVNSHTGARGFAFIDTRTTPEYLGTGSRGGLPSEGHVAGARQLEWQQLFSDANTAVFLEPAELRKLFADRVTPGDTVVTYCLVGYRASMTYFGARMLGYPVRLYDGSYQEWARRALPVKKGERP